MSINGNGAYTGNYAFNLLNASTGATAITAGTSASPTGATVAGTLSPANSTILYKFNATAGDQFLFHNISITAGTNAMTWSLIDPYVAIVFGGAYLGNDQSGVAMNYTGSYTLAVSGSVSDTINTAFQFKANWLFNTPPANTTIALSFGTVYNSTTNPIGGIGRSRLQVHACRQRFSGSATSRPDGNNGNYSIAYPGGGSLSPSSF